MLINKHIRFKDLSSIRFKGGQQVKAEPKKQTNKPTKETCTSSHE